MAGYTTNLLTGLAQHLAAAGVGVWNPAGVYTAGQAGIVLGAVPPAPDRIITLTGYGVTDDPTLADTVTGVQVRCRWAGADPRLVDDLADQVFDLWQGSGPLTLSTGVRVLLLQRRSSTSLGTDGNGRWSRADNFYVTTHRPSTHRL